MLVIDHFLFEDENHPVPFLESPNSDPGLKPLYIVMHFTAGSSAKSAISVLSDPRPDDPDRRVSAHLVVSRTGEITQLVPFDRIAYHTGNSYWENRKFVNPVSIGIELDNEGWFEMQDGEWTSSTGIVATPDTLHFAVHPKGVSELGWKVFPEVQWQAALRAAQALVAHFDTIRDVVGHEDVHQEKVDPGPAFNMKDFRLALFGREQPLVELYETTRQSLIYQNEGGRVPILPERHPVNKLPVDTKLKVLKKVKDPKTETIWCMVEVKKAIAGFHGVQGWVQNSLLKDTRVISPAPIYLDTGDIPKRETPTHAASPFIAPTVVRRLETVGDWTFICTAEKQHKFGYVFAWLPTAAIRLRTSGGQLA